MRARLFAAFLLVAAVPAFASIRGTVMTIEGQAIAGAKVSMFALEPSSVRSARLVSKTPDRVALASGTTDSKGSFVLDSPKDPVVLLQIEARGYGPAALRVEREEEAVVSALRNASPTQGTISASGKPVAGARVIWSSGAAELVATTDAAGHYSVPDLSRWAATVTVLHPDFAPFTESFGGSKKPDLNFSLDPGTSLTGKVVKGSTAVASVTVLVDGWPLGITNDDGSFSIAHAPKKWDTVEALAADLTARQARIAGNLTLKASAPSTIAGTVRDSKTQQPVAGAELSFGQPMARGMRVSVVSAITDAKGTFTTAIAPGVYQIYGAHPAYSIAMMNVSIAAGQHVQKALAAAPNAKIVGTVVDEQKRGIAAANVSAEVASSGTFGMRRMMMPGRSGAFSGPDGRFTLRTSDAGDLELRATKKGLPDGKSSIVRVASGDRKSGITITMPQGVVFSGHVVDRDGKPVSGVAITTMIAESGGGRLGGQMVRRMILGMAQPDQDAATTGSDGKFTLRVKEGSYEVKFAREGFATKTLRGHQVSASTKPVEMTMEPGVEISGRIVRSGAGVEGVNVGAMDTDSRSYATTTSDGHFVLNDLTPGTYAVNIAKPDEFIQLMRSLSAPTHDVTIEIPAGGRVSGHVVDKSTREPVTTFQAGINPSRSGGGMMVMMNPQLRSFTSDDGSFALENVPPGALQLVVSAPGYTTAHVPSITLEEGKSVSDVEVALETGVRLVGHVSGPNGTPLAGAAVRPNSAGGMRIPGMPGQAAATTDANGDYSIDDLEAGDNKSFTFSSSGYLPAEKTTNLSGKETRLDVQLSSGMSVSGMVVTDGGVPVPEADVRASSAATGSTPKMAKTDGSGTFVLDTVAPGRYAFGASKSGFADGMLTDFDVSGGASPRIVLKAGGTLTGHVSGLSDADLLKATVTVRSANGSSEASVDASGNYRIDGAPTGTLRVSASLSLMRGFGETRSTEMKTVDLAAGGSAQVDLVFSSDTVISGHITRNGVPASNSMIQFSPRAGTVQTRASTSTDDGGKYTVSGLAAGDYGVSVVDMQRLSPYSTTYSVHGSGTFDIDIRTSSLRGHVIDRGDSTPLSGARVQIRRSDAQSTFMALNAMSDDSGAFVLDSISAGTYSISAEKDGYGNVVKDITVADSAPQHVMLDLMRNDGVTLNVVDGRDGRTLNGIVSVYDAQNRPVYESTRFGGSDSQRIPLATGQYHAAVAANGYAPKSVSFMSPSTQTVALTPGGALIIRSKSSVVQRAMLIDSNGAPYQRFYSMDPSFNLGPGETRFQNVNPGAYTLQILGPNGAVTATKSVVVVEGQEIAVDL
jgi:protocatechuate 3,4-dioxygenase beta subunit